MESKMESKMESGKLAVRSAMRLRDEEGSGYILPQWKSSSMKATGEWMRK